MGGDCAASTRASCAAKRLCPLQQRQLDVVVGGTVGDRDAYALAWIDHKLGRVSQVLLQIDLGIVARVRGVHLRVMLKIRRQPYSCVKTKLTFTVPVVEVLTHLTCRPSPTRMVGTC